MKKIIKPAVSEEAVYISDFTEFDFEKFDPHVELKLSFNYGSKYDGTDFVLHLTDDEIMPILEVIKNNLSESFKKEINRQLKFAEKNQEELIQSRDWSACEYGQKAIDFISIFTDKNNL
jgi:hypothetical protein